MDVEVQEHPDDLDSAMQTCLSDLFFDLAKSFLLQNGYTYDVLKLNLIDVEWFFVMYEVRRSGQNSFMWSPCGTFREAYVYTYGPG